jgi:U8 snoRNA-decapping enzyme
MSKKIINASFLAVISKDYLPYRNDKRLSEDIRNMAVPTVFMINRADGKIGFPGGTMDNDETPLETVLRECEEEINVDFSCDKLEYVGAFKYENDSVDLTTHLFVLFLPQEELVDIFRDVTPNSEITGYVARPIINYRKGGYDEFLKNNFPPTAKEQLEALVEKYKLLIVA